MACAGNSGISRKVISVSRRIDMLASFPDALLELLTEKCPPETVHTLVIWTKNPANLFDHPELNTMLNQYDQLFLHLTVTGMSGSRFEPNVPQPGALMHLLPRIVEYVGTPERIRFRFDPIVHFQVSDGQSYTNLSWFEKLAPMVAEVGIRNVSTSWISEYKKVVNRLKRLGISIIPQSGEERLQDLHYLNEIADKRQFVTALIVPDFDQLSAEGIGQENDGSDPESLVKNRQVKR